MGSMLTGLFESLGRYARPDQTEMMLDAGVLERGLTNAVKDNDAQFPPDFRLSRVRPRPAGRGAPVVSDPVVSDMAPARSTATWSSTCPAGSRARTARGCWPTAGPRWSRSSRPRVTPCAAGPPPVHCQPDGRDAPLFSYLAGGKQSVVFGPDGERAAADLDELLDHAHAVVWSPGPAARVADGVAGARPTVGRRSRCCPPTRTWRWPR